MNKKYLSIILILSIVFTSIPINRIYAKPNINLENQIFISKENLSKEYIRNTLINTFGFSEKEVENLFNAFPVNNSNYRINNFNNNQKFLGIINISKLLNELSLGDVRYETYTFNLDEIRRVASSLGFAITIASPGLGLTAKQWVSVLVTLIGYEIIALSAVIAGVVGGLVNYIFQPYNGVVDVKLKYKWAYFDNSMQYNWMLTGDEIIPR